MARVVVLGAGVSGHTAASFLRKWLGRDHQVVVVSPLPDYGWIPSNIWVGVGKMRPDQVVFPLAPVYARAGVDFHQARAVALHPEGRGDDARPFVVIEHTGEGRAGEREEVLYDFLINATGPRLDFDRTPGLGPEGGHTLSVCTAAHAEEASRALEAAIARMEAGEKQTFVVGTGHGSCTCQGAAFEYIVNLEFEVRSRGVRDRARIVYLSNEHELGDFGMGGMHLKMGGYVTPSSVFTESLYAERGIEWVTQAHVRRVEPGRIHYLTLDGDEVAIDYDFAMLLPPFSGIRLEAYDGEGRDIRGRLFAPNGFMKVDADYTNKPYEAWSAEDWPATYQSPVYPNLFATGIAFAPPHPISRPRSAPDGTPISPTPPRTGMPSAMIGKAVARSVVDMMTGKAEAPVHTACMAEMGAACVASAGASPWKGTAAAITVFPIVPDFEKYPEYGRDLRHTFGEVGLAGHWIKTILHYLFLYKARLRPGWTLIPE